MLQCCCCCCIAVSLSCCVAVLWVVLFLSCKTASSSFCMPRSLLHPFTPSPFLSFTILLFPRLIHITFSHIYFPLSITQSLLQIAHEASAIAGVNSRAQLAHLTSLLGIEQESLRESAESYRDVEAKYQALRITVAEKDVLLKRY